MIYVVVILCIVIVSISVRYLHMEEAMDHLEEDNKDLQFELDESIEEIEHLKKGYLNLFEQHDRFMGEVIDKDISRMKTIYYDPRSNNIVKFSELEELGEL